MSKTDKTFVIRTMKKPKARYIGGLFHFYRGIYESDTHCRSRDR